MSKTKIAHLHTIDQAGGGAKIVRELHTELNTDEKFSSRLFVGEKKTNIDSVTELPSIPFEKEFNRFVEQILSFEGLAAPSSFRYPKIINNYDPDIIHLHNIHGNYFNIINIMRLLEDVPAIWTFHDMWPLTGRCVYSYDCEKYTDVCHNCPYLDISKQISFDSTKQLHKLKKKIFDFCNPYIISPSKWMTENIRKSFFETSTVEHIPHGINTDFFMPKPTIESRKEFDIPQNSTVVLFISNGLSTPRKGMNHLLSALHKIKIEDITLFAVGGEEMSEDKIPNNFQLFTPGYIDNDKLPFAYSAADLTVVPSLYESFGLVATESMSCGTPVVAYDTSGLGEQITDTTGWLAEFKNPDSLASVIEEAIKNKERRQTKAQKARQRVKKKYDQQRFFTDHKAIYEQVNDSTYND